MQKTYLIIILMLVLSTIDQVYAQQGTSNKPGFDVVVNMFATGFLFISIIITIIILLFIFRKHIPKILRNMLGERFNK